MKLLIAYDGSKCSVETISDLTRAGLPEQVEALVMTPADVFLPTGAGSAETNVLEPAFSIVKRAREHATAAVEAARQIAETGRAHVQTLFRRWDVTAQAYADSPAWAIIKKADEWKADLVVVGSHSHAPLARLFLGSVSQKVLNEASCSVRIGRSGHSASGPVRLLVGFDGSPRSEEVVRWVVGREWAAGTEARVVTVVDPKVTTLLSALDPTQTVWIQPTDEDQTTWVRRMAEASAQSLRKGGLLASALVLEGDPKRLLVEQAEHWAADCIFVGATGLGAFERFLLGTVSAAVAARVHCSIEVVRPLRSSTELPLPA